MLHYFYHLEGRGGKEGRERKTKEREEQQVNESNIKESDDSTSRYHIMHLLPHKTCVNKPNNEVMWTK